MRSHLILGSGFAGQGHALALRDAGVEVVGMAGRTRDVIETVSATLNIPHAWIWIPTTAGGFLKTQEKYVVATRLMLKNHR